MSYTPETMRSRGVSARLQFMSIESRNALNRLIAAFEHHYDMAKNAEVVQAEILEEAEDRLRDAFFTYDDELYTRFGVELPFEMLEDESEDDFDGDELDDDSEDLLDGESDLFDDQVIIGFEEED